MQIIKFLSVILDSCCVHTLLLLNRPRPYLNKNDHTYPGATKTDVPVVILYAEIGTKKFTVFHKVLSEKAEEGKLIYVLRHFVAVSTNAYYTFSSLSGYAKFLYLLFFTVVCLEFSYKAYNIMYVSYFQQIQ